MTVTAAKHAGFCTGVQRCVAMAQEAAQQAVCRGIPCYSLGEVVHNPSVTQRLSELGIQVVQQVEDARGGLLILRSHGVSPDIPARCEALGIPYVDCTCMHVQALHNIVDSYRDPEGSVVLVGERDHPEVQGTAGWSHVPVYVVFSPEDVAALPKLSKALVVSQTTIPEEKWDLLVPLLEQRIASPDFHRSICAATRMRQQAAKELAAQCDAMIVIGGRKSANTRKLYEACAKICPHPSHRNSRRRFHTGLVT